MLRDIAERQAYYAREAMKLNGSTVTPRKSCLTAAVVSRMAQMGQRKAISTVGMKGK